MKSLIIASALVLSPVAFSQDGYHSLEEVSCEANESCLITGIHNHVLKLLPVENRAGSIVGAHLSSDSFLADTVYDGGKACYTGEAAEVCTILELSSSAEGGDAIIGSFECNIEEDSIKLSYSVEYYGYGKENLNFVINRCE